MECQAKIIFRIILISLWVIGMPCGTISRLQNDDIPLLTSIQPISFYQIEKLNPMDRVFWGRALFLQRSIRHASSFTSVTDYVLKLAPNIQRLTYRNRLAESYTLKIAHHRMWVRLKDCKVGSNLKKMMQDEWKMNERRQASIWGNRAGYSGNIANTQISRLLVIFSNQFVDIWNIFRLLNIFQRR